MSGMTTIATLGLGLQVLRFVLQMLAEADLSVKVNFCTVLHKFAIGLPLSNHTSLLCPTGCLDFEFLHFNSHDFDFVVWHVAELLDLHCVLHFFEVGLQHLL